MEGLAPPLKCILEIERALERGISVRVSCYAFTAQPRNEFDIQLRQLVMGFDRQETFAAALSMGQSAERKALLETLWRGLNGEPILSTLRHLRTEIEHSSRLELDAFMAKLPLRALVPLLLFILPAFLILLFGPLMNLLMEGVL